MDDLKKELENDLIKASNKPSPMICYTCIALAVAAGVVLGNLVTDLITAAYLPSLRIR